MRLGESVNYQSAGTVEYIYDDERDEFYFLEVNTRLQVEHGVTEAVFGVDLVAWMVMLAGGEQPPLDADYRSRGHAMEVRIYAEDALKDFQPSPGELTEVSFPDDIRLDGWVDTGTRVSPHYDPMLAKVIAHGRDREEALRRLRRALRETGALGLVAGQRVDRQDTASKKWASRAANAATALDARASSAVTARSMACCDVSTVRLRSRA